MITEIFDNLVEQEDISDELIEKLASLEHAQWIDWAKNILETEDITAERVGRWEALFVP